jgi:hypothetical protein
MSRPPHPPVMNYVYTFAKTFARYNPHALDRIFESACNLCLSDPSGGTGAWSPAVYLPTYCCSGFPSSIYRKITKHLQAVEHYFGGMLRITGICVFPSELWNSPYSVFILKVLKHCIGNM